VSNSTVMSASITRWQVWHRAWPLIIASASVPLLGIVDTAVIGNIGTVYDLGALALGSLIFSFVYWGFGFLRMGTTGFVAQADGSQDFDEVRAIAGRSLFFGFVTGLVLILLQQLLARFAFTLLGGSENVEEVASIYFYIRIWGAPATLGTFALVGVLIGLGESKKLLLVQLFLNLLNALLDIVLAGYYGLGARGIAAGTLIAEWSSCLFALFIVHRCLKSLPGLNGSVIVWGEILRRDKILTMLSANWDILIRTLALLGSFAWFTNQSARYGDVTLAANHVLLQLISFSAFFLDGFAYVAESLVGRAVGARNRLSFNLAVARTTELAAAAAILLTVSIWFLGPVIIVGLTDILPVQQQAIGLLVYPAVYVLLCFPAFQLDGIFIGATFTRQMRNASLASLAIFLVVWAGLSPLWGVQGLWIAFIIYVSARAATLFYYFPRLRAMVIN